jgi:hypothetical protein
MSMTGHLPVTQEYDYKCHGHSMCPYESNNFKQMKYS